MTMFWSEESLWAKAQVYAERADQEVRDGPLFAFWSHLTLEFLVRAAVASLHPVLLAERGRSAKSLLYALELGSEGDPKSLGSGDLLHLCVEIFPDFTREHRDAGLAMLGRRNRELHSGEPAFEDLRPEGWLADYYRLADVLLSVRGRDLADLFGFEEAEAARHMISALEAEAKSAVFGLVAAARRVWERIPADEQRMRATAAAAQPRPALAKRGRCPACQSPVSIEGEQVVVSQTRLDGGNELVEELRMLPTRMACAACELRLSGHAELHAAGIGGQYTLLREVDPVEFHSIDIDSYVDPDRYIPIPDGPEYQDE